MEVSYLNDSLLKGSCGSYCRVLRMFKGVESWVYIYKNEKHWKEKKNQYPAWTQILNMHKFGLWIIL